MYAGEYQLDECASHQENKHNCTTFFFKHQLDFSNLYSTESTLGQSKMYVRAKLLTPVLQLHTVSPALHITFATLLI